MMTVLFNISERIYHDRDRDFKNNIKQQTNKKNSSALSDYNVLCNNINYLNTAFKSYLQLLSETQEKISKEFESDTSLNEEYKSDKDLNSILPIVNRIVKNSIVVFEKFSNLTKSDIREERQYGKYPYARKKVHSL
jgi:hypothetical protein